MRKKIYQMSIEETAEYLGTDVEEGLSEESAKQRLAQYGPNEIKEKPRTTPLLMFLHQFTDALIIVLLVAALISGLTGELADALLIVAIVFLNAVLGFLQEFRAEKAVRALKKMAMPHVRVVREGRVREIPASQVVPGDLLLLETGDIVVADGRLVECVNLSLNEASLTGESSPVPKTTEPLKEDDLPLAERHNMVFSGTMVTSGRGKILVVSTGMETELGKISQLLQEQEEGKTPLQRKMAYVGKWLVVIALAICGLVFLGGVLRGNEIRDMFLTAVSLAVAAIPEGLPAVITISLALGARRMARRNALIRRLSAVETLGSITHICSDKTGTITENKMMVEFVYVNDQLLQVTGRGYAPEGKFLLKGEEISPLDDPHLELLLQAVALCNDAHLVKEGEEWRIIGDPTEGALVVLSAKAGLSKQELEKKMPRVGEVPFDSHRKRMSTLHKIPGGEVIVFVKGALEGILRLSSSIYKGEKVESLSEAQKEEILALGEDLARQGMRILGVAFKLLPQIPEEADEELERDLVFLGFVAMQDPPRPEAIEAVRVCFSAGIRPLMITGDQKETAVAIGKQVGIVEKENEVINGRELERMNDEELDKVLDEVKGFARVSPEQKLRIVETLRKKGYITAVTGDGVNDAPALKQADVGVAMGITGTDVSKEASDMILLDDNFATIVSAIEEGRVIYDNIRKFLRYMLTTNFGEILTLFFAIVFGIPVPLLPAQILWINLLTDGLPALALGREPAEPGVMQRPPRPPKESIFAGKMLYHILWGGMWMAMGSLLLFLWFWGGQAENIRLARTSAFATLSFFQLFNALALRSEKHSFFALGVLSNPYLLGAVFLSFLLQLIVLYIPPLQALFKTQPLSISQLGFCLLTASTIFFLLELQKWIKKRKGETL